MPAIPADLDAFLMEHRDSRKYRRGLAVKLALQGQPYATICDLLAVTPGFVSQVKRAYQEDGVDGLRLGYRGTPPFLSADDRQTVIAWIQAQNQWSVDTLCTYLTTTYQVTYRSLQSYYALFAAAGISYKRVQSRNPKHDPAAVAAKKKRLSPS